MFGPETLATLLAGLLVLALRVVDMSLDTLRVSFLVRGSRGLASWIGFLEALVFICGVSIVLQGPLAIPQVLGYAGGFALGNYFGMRLASLLPGFVMLHVISRERGEDIARDLRSRGYGATVFMGQGLNGPVAMLYCIVRHHQHAAACAIVKEHDPQALVVSEPVQMARGGFMGFPVFPTATIGTRS
jgi:uncharacterized protein YebE (UPF0316 family)